MCWVVLAGEAGAIQIIVLCPSASSASCRWVVAGAALGIPRDLDVIREMGNMLLPHLLLLVAGRFSLI